MTTVDVSDSQVQGELKDSTGIGKIVGNEITLTAFKQTRGKPSAYTPADAIGADGKTDYFTIETSKPIDVDGTKFDSFFVTGAIVSQLGRVTNLQEIFARGDEVGPVKVVKRQSAKDKTRNYLCFAFPNDEDY